jgi:hypothetical protein
VARERFGTVQVFQSGFRPLTNRMGAEPENVFLKLIVSKADQRVRGVLAALPPPPPLRCAPALSKAVDAPAPPRPRGGGGGGVPLCRGGAPHRRRHRTADAGWPRR